MKAFIFDPLWDDLVDNDLRSKLTAANIEAIVIKEIGPLADYMALYEGDEEQGNRIKSPC